MSGIDGVVAIGLTAQGVDDVINGISGVDALNAVSAIGQLLSGVQTALAPVGDFTGWANLLAASSITTKILRDANDPAKDVDPIDLMSLGANLLAVGLSLGKVSPWVIGLNTGLGVMQGGINNQVQHPTGKVPRWASTTNNSRLKNGRRS